MDKFETMRRFVLVARTGSFTRAAEIAALPKSSMSQAVQNLENLLSVRLFNRSTRSLSLTSDGQRYLMQCASILDDLEDLEARFQAESELKGVLRVDMPARFATTVVIPRLADWFDTYPGVSLNISSADYRVDLIKEGIDCVVRVGELHDSNLIARPLTRYKMINCASPDYLDNLGTPITIDDLGQHFLIDYAPGMATGHAEFDYLHKGKLTVQCMPSRLTVGGTEAYLAACLSGAGIAQLPAMGVAELLNAGRLVRILPDSEPPAMPVNLLCAARLGSSPKVQLFTHWLSGVIRDKENTLPQDCRT